MTLNARTNPWFQHIPSKVPAKSRLFCFPYAGGSSAVYAPWREFLPHDVELCLVQMPGRGMRFGDPLISNLDELVAALLYAITPYTRDLEYRFFGHSMGARVSYELALAIEQAGLRVPSKLNVSACLPPHLPRKRKPLHDLPDEQFVRELESLNGTPKEILENPEMMALAKPILRADFKLCETWVVGPNKEINSPMRVFGGHDDPDILEQDLTQWSQYTSSTCELEMYQGDHFFMHDHGKRLAERVMN